MQRGAPFQYTDGSGHQMMFDPRTGQNYTLMTSAEAYQQQTRYGNSQAFPTNVYLQQDNYRYASVAQREHYMLDDQSSVRGTNYHQQSQTSHPTQQQTKKTAPTVPHYIPSTLPTDKTLSTQQPLPPRSQQQQPDSPTPLTHSSIPQSQDGASQYDATASAFHQSQLLFPLPASLVIAAEDHQDPTVLASTPSAQKRGHNDSDEFITVTSKKTVKAAKLNHQQQLNQQQSSARSYHEDNLRARTTAASMGVNPRLNKYDIPMDQLKRAVSHNLPCFNISFDNEDRPPSAVIAAEVLYDHFKQKNIRMNGDFSVVRYIGRQLKIGVRDKSDYSTLCDRLAWPAVINGCKITVHIPKFIPEQFTLVVRYVPPEFTLDHVTREVQNSARTADNFRAIIYPYKRQTNDFRFTVADMQEYNGLLRLGHIGIGNGMRPVTQYRPANKLTYCTKCWRLEHTRDQCDQYIQKCRVCLLDFDENHNNVCTKSHQCAQCHQDHPSLDPNCGIVQKYRNSLNQAVKQAVGDGTIRRASPEGLNSAQIPVPQVVMPAVDQLSFPLMTSTTKLATGNSGRSPWYKQTQNQSRSVQDMSNQQLLERLCERYDEKVKHIEGKIQKIEYREQINEENSILMNKESRTALRVINLLIKEVIKPIVSTISTLDPSITEKLNSALKVIEECDDRLRTKYTCDRIGEQERQPRSGPRPHLTNTTNSNTRILDDENVDEEDERNNQQAEEQQLNENTQQVSMSDSDDG